MENKSLFTDLNKNLPFLEEAYELLLDVNSVDRTRERQIVERNTGVIRKIHGIMLDDIFTCPYIQGQIEARSGSAYLGAAWKMLQTTDPNNIEDSAQLSDYVKKGLVNFIHYMRAYYSYLQSSDIFDATRDGEDYVKCMQLVDSYENDSVMKHHLLEYGGKYYSKEVMGTDPYDTIGVVDEFLENVRSYVKDGKVIELDDNNFRLWISRYIKANTVTPKDFNVDAEMTFKDFLMNKMEYRENLSNAVMQAIFPEYKPGNSRVMTVDIDNIDIDWDGEDDE